MPPNSLKQIILDRILREGPVSFAAFMDLALYHPDFGHYMSEPVQFGSEGDYYTSPQLHPVFGRWLAIQLDEMRKLIGKPDGFTILEIGAGNGGLAAGIIGHILEDLRWNTPWKYVIVERNPLVRAEQSKTLRPYTEPVGWKTSLDDVEPFRGCVVANELLDAFPVHRIGMKDRFREVYVDSEDNRFTEVYDDFSSDELKAYLDTYHIPAIGGYRTEVNLKIHSFLESVSRLLSDGFFLTFDYGYPAHQYYAPERNQGTLLCYFRHTAADNPYRRVGRQDITAHVNFTSLKDWGNACGMRTLGYGSQGAFLASLATAAETSADRRLNLEAMPLPERLKIKNLLLDMGTTHQVMVQYKGPRNLEKLMGFAVSNRLQSL